LVTGVKRPGLHGAIYDAAARAKGTTVPPPATRLNRSEEHDRIRIADRSQEEAIEARSGEEGITTRRPGIWATMASVASE
jgi:hypothetical protein